MKLKMPDETFKDRPPAAPDQMVLLRQLRDALTAVLGDDGYTPLPETGWLTLGEVLHHVKMSRSQWFRCVKDGQLPKPHKVGRLSFWKVRDIRHLLDAGPRRPVKRLPPRLPVAAPEPT